MTKTFGWGCLIFSFSLLLTACWSGGDGPGELGPDAGHDDGDTVTGQKPETPEPSDVMGEETSPSPPESDAGDPDQGESGCPGAGTECNRPPAIENVSTSPGTLTPGAELTVEVSVSDPDGTSDLASGTLRDPQTGSSYTRFKPEVGSYTATVSWADINAVRRISGNSRRFRIVFRDSANQTAERDVDVDVGCERSGYGLCSGECEDFQSTFHCGRCNNECPDNENCVSGQCRCSGSDVARCGGGRCNDLKWDRDNCGQCGNSCIDWASSTPNPDDAHCESKVCNIDFETENPGDTSCSSRCQQYGMRCENATAVYAASSALGSDDWVDWGCSSTPPESDDENPAGQPLEEYTCVCVES